MTTERQTPETAFPSPSGPLSTTRSEGGLWILIRMDRIGDVVLTLPCDEPLRDLGKRVKWILGPATQFVIQRAQPARDYELRSPKFSWREFWQTVIWLKAARPEGVILFQAPTWMFWAVLTARIPQRWGVLSRPVSFLCLNHGLRQHRSEAAKHESEYNMDLVREVLAQSAPPTWAAPVPLPQKSFHPLTLRASGTAPGGRHLPDFPARYIVIHAGMAGSARNWSVENYAACLGLLVPYFEIVMTGTIADRPYLLPLQSNVQDARIHWWNERLSGDELLQVLARAAAVVAPSTGVVHLAASLGVPTLGLYSPVRVQAPQRWAPLGPHVNFLVPTALSSFQCPGHFHCLMEKCPHFDCMNLITPAQVTEWVRTHAHQSK